MGISPSIQNLEAEDQAFHMYVNVIRRQLSAQANDLNQRIANLAAGWKADNADARVIVIGQNIDLQESSFSLDNLQSTIHGIISAVLTGASAPTGVTVVSAVQQGLQKTLSPALTDLSTPELLISSHALDTISGIIHDIGRPGTAAFNSSVASHSLGFGLRMFVGVAGRTYTSVGNEDIYAYVFTYQVLYSVKQSRDYLRHTPLVGVSQGAHRVPGQDEGSSGA